MEAFSKSIEKFREAVQYYLGLPVILKSNDEKCEIGMNINIHGLGRNLQKLCQKIYQCMGTEIDIDKCNNSYEINKYFSVILTTLIFGKSLEEDKVYKFLNNINKLSEMTYENEKLETGIYVAEEDVIKQFCKKNEWELYKGSSEDFDEIIYSNKAMRKLINNREFAYCFNENLEYIGIISNNNESKNIIDRMKMLQTSDLRMRIEEQLIDICEYFSDNLKDMVLEVISDDSSRGDAEKILDMLKEIRYQYQYMERENEIPNVLYIEVSNNGTRYYLNPYTYVEEKHGEWRLHEYLSIVSLLFPNVMIKSLWAEGKDEFMSVVDVIHKLVVIIKEMSLRNAGGLLIIAQENVSFDEIIACDENQNFKKIFGQSEEMELMNVTNEKLIDLLSIDGATIINSDLKLIDFGRIIKNRIQNNNEYGARTNAAMSASRYGTAIKISEDGDVTVFMKEKKCKRYESF